MKTTHVNFSIIVLAVCALLLASCAKDDNDVKVNAFACKNFPLSNGSSWDYEYADGTNITKFTLSASNVKQSKGIIAGTIHSTYTNNDYEVSCNTNTGIVTSTTNIAGTSVSIDLLKETASVGSNWTHYYTIGGIPTRYDVEIISLGGTRMVNGVNFKNVTKVQQDTYVDLSGSGNYTFVETINHYYAENVGGIESEYQTRNKFIRLLSYNIIP